MIAPREKTWDARWLLSGDHSSPSSLTAFVMMQMSSSSALSLALREEDDGKRAGSVTEPASILYCFCTSYCFALFILLHILLLFLFFYHIYALVLCYFYIIFIFILLHCPLSGPDLIYISLLIIPCIIYYVTNNETLNLDNTTAAAEAFQRQNSVSAKSQP